MANQSFKLVALGEVIQIFDSKRVPLSGIERSRRKGKYPYYGAQGVIDHIDSYVFDGRYLLIPEDGENLRSRKLPIAYFADGRFWVNNHAHIIRGVSMVSDDDYIMYAITNTDISPWVTGTAQPKLSQENLKKILVRLPSYPIQGRIAKILKSYDLLMRNNSRRIELLEQIAKLVYDEWFVRFEFPGHEKVKMVNSNIGEIPDNWNPSRFSEMVEIDPRTSVRNKDKVIFVPMSALSDNSMMINESTFKVREFSGGSKFRNGDILFPRITPSLENGKAGFVQFLGPGETATGSTEFIILRSRSVNPYYLYFLARDERLRQHAAGSMVGASGRQRVQTSCFDGFYLPHPQNDTLTKFASVAEPIFHEIGLLSKSNARLRQVRDLLLPNLISGEIDASNVDIKGPEMEA